jgi:hypothetical protein
MLTANITSLTASVASLTAAYTILMAGTSAPQALGTQCPRDNTRKGYLAENEYCWTHGYRVNKGHNSITCKNKADVHKDGATQANTMNGSTNNKGWDT